MPFAGRYAVLGMPPGTDAAALVTRLGALAIDESIVIGLGEPLVRAVGGTIEGLRTFPSISGIGCAIPASQGALLVHVRGSDHGATLHQLRRVLAALGELRLDEEVATYRFDIGRDLTGYEDGTENPKGDLAVAAALAADGSSFVAAQRWRHELRTMERLTVDERDAIIGRDLVDNHEIADAPPSAHVKRAAQESFEPTAFMVRRSMPYGGVDHDGLYFVAYGATLDPFERVLRRMVGLDDGIVDSLFRYSRPESGGYYWCPPVRDGRLALDRLRA